MPSITKDQIEIDLPFMKDLWRKKKIEKESARKHKEWIEVEKCTFSKWKNEFYCKYDGSVKDPVKHFELPESWFNFSSEYKYNFIKWSNGLKNTIEDMFKNDKLRFWEKKHEINRIMKSAEKNSDKVKRRYIKIILAKYGFNYKLLQNLDFQEKDFYIEIIFCGNISNESMKNLNVRWKKHGISNLLFDFIVNKSNIQMNFLDFLYIKLDNTNIEKIKDRFDKNYSFFHIEDCSNSIKESVNRFLFLCKYGCFVKFTCKNLEDNKHYNIERIFIYNNYQDFSPISNSLLVVNKDFLKKYCSINLA